MIGGTMSEEKKDPRMTRQVRVYEESAMLIEAIVKRRPPNTKFADIVEEALKKTYPEAYKAIEKSSNLIDSAIENDEGEN
jgi:hypothetical protein